VAANPLRTFPPSIFHLLSSISDAKRPPWRALRSWRERFLPFCRARARCPRDGSGETPELRFLISAFQLFSFSAFQLFSDTRLVILERLASRSLWLLLLSVSLSCGGMDGAAKAQDLTPISFLERAQTNSAILNGTYSPRTNGLDRLTGPGPRTTTRSAAEFAEDYGVTTEGSPFAPGTGAQDTEGAAAEPGELAGPESEFAQGVKSAFLPRRIQLGFDVTLRAEYDSNVTVGDEGPRIRGSRATIQTVDDSNGKEDFVFSALLNTRMTWQFAGGYSIGLALAIEYREYLSHPEFSGLFINTTAPIGLAVRFKTGDVQWTLHDYFSFTNDPEEEPELSGVTRFSQFSNSIGVDAAWSATTHFGLRGGYEHVNTIGSSSAGDRDSSSDALQFAAIYGVTPEIQTGLSATATVMKETGDFATDSTTLAIGPFLRGPITPATRIFLTAGVQYTNFDNSSSSPSFEGDGNNNNDSGGSGGTSFYGSLRITNELTHFYTHTLSLGRDTQAGYLSDSVTTDFIRYAGTWQLGRGMTLSGDVYAERSTQAGGPFGDQFVRVGGGLVLAVPIRPTISANIGWEHTKKDSDQNEFDYTRDRVFLSVSWFF
jgi:hypothetical protein